MNAQFANTNLGLDSILAALIDKDYGNLDASTHKQAVIKDLKLGMSTAATAEQAQEYKALLAGVLKKKLGLVFVTTRIESGVSVT